MTTNNSSNNSRVINKMTRTNFKEIFNSNNGIDIGDFLIKVTETYNPNSLEYLHIKLIELLVNNQFVPIELAKAFIKLKFNYDSKLVEYIVDKIISDYNNIYCVDKYYYGYWYEGNCYTDETMEKQV